MSILLLVAVIVVVGVVLWCINRWVPMEAPYKTLLNVVVLLGLITWVLFNVGMLQKLPVEVAVTVVWVGVLLWFVEKFIPMDETVKTILKVATVVALVLWILWLFLDAFGLLGSLQGISHQKIGK